LLTDSAYADATLLRARQRLYDHAEPRCNLYRWAIGLASWRGDETVLDVGCGNGRYLQEIAGLVRGARLVALDLSPGMTKDLAAAWPPGLPSPSVVVADAQRLPVEAASADVVLAMHVLYHVPDIDRAVAELRRAVKDSGTVLVATKGDRHLPAIRQVVSDAVAAVTGTGLTPLAWNDRFTLENGGDRLSRVFRTVSLQVLDQRIVVSSLAAPVAYVHALRPFLEPVLVPSGRWQAVADEVSTRIAFAVASAGSFTDHSVVGVFVCRP
jgi:SAM-dependent methyltransferase